ncbi:MAG: hypothetical protein K8R77_08250 [Anaerolineaceae bacterium]|nr:hypothetical protein [Anaerolineaceae bacterium]
MPIQKSKNTYTRIGDKEDHKRNQIISQAAGRRLFEMVYAWQADHFLPLFGVLTDASQTRIFAKPIRLNL